MIGSSTTSNNSFQIQVFDGARWSDISVFAVSTYSSNANKAKIVDIEAVSNPILESVKITDYFNVTDVDGSTPRSYRFRDSAVGAGYFMLNGVKQAENTQFEITVGQVHQLEYYTGDKAGNEGIFVSVNDGGTWSDTARLSATNSANNAAPTVVGVSPLLRIAARVSLSSMFSFNDADNNTMKSLRVLDLSSASQSGYLQKDDTGISASVWHEISADELYRYTFIGAQGAWNDQVRFQVYDGSKWSGIASHTQATVNNRYAPTLEVFSFATNEKAFRNLDGLFTMADQDGDAVQFVQVQAYGTGTLHGKFFRDGVEMAGNVWHTIARNEIDQWKFQAGKVGINTQIGIQASDGFSYTPVKVLDFRSVSSTPKVVAFNKTIVPNGLVTLSSMFSYSDNEGQPMLQIRVRDTNTFGGSGSLFRAGVQQDAGVWHMFSAVELEAWTFRTNENRRQDRVQIQAYDGYAWSNIGESIVTASSAPPEVTTEGTIVVAPMTVFQLSDMFTYSDADGHPMQRLRVIEGNANPISGFLAKNGVKQETFVWHEILVSDLSQWTYTSADFIGGDRMRFRVYDGFDWSDAAQLDVISNSTAPEVNPIDRTVLPKTTMTLSSLFNYSDADGDPMSMLRVRDTNTGLSSGHLLRGGVMQAAGIEFTIAASDVLLWSFVSGDFIGADELSFSVNDGYQWSAGEIGTVTSDTQNPSVIAFDYTALPATTFDLTQLFQYTDPDGLPIQFVEVIDLNASLNSGFFEVGGVRQNAGVRYEIAVSDFDEWTFVSGAHLVNDNIDIRVSNGYKWSSADISTVGSFSNTPTVKAFTKAINHDDSIKLSYLFEFSDVDDGDSLAAIRIIDRNTNRNSGFLTRDGSVMPSNVWHEILVSNLDQWKFMGGTYLTEDNYSVQVSDGHTWSSIANANLVWRNLYDPLLVNFSKPARQQSSSSVDSGLGYLFQFPGNVEGDNFQVLGDNLYNRDTNEFLDPEVVHTFSRSQFQNDIRVVSSSPDNSPALLQMEQLLVRVEIDGIWSQWSNINLLDAPNIDNGLDPVNPNDSFWAIEDGADTELVITTPLIGPGFLTYWWHDGVPNYYDSSDVEVRHGQGFDAPNTKAQDAIVEILDMYTDVTGLQFREWNPVLDPPEGIEYDLAFGWVDMTDYPFPVDAYTKGVPDGFIEDTYLRGGDMWFNTFYNSGDHDITDPDKGEYGYTVYIREIARALGLEYTTTGLVSLGEVDFYSGAPDYLGVSHTYNTTLSREIAYHVNPSTPMLYEILELQSRYGRGRGGEGNTLYQFDDSLPEVKTIWDFSGTDTISFELARITSGDGYSAMIDLRDGASSYLHDPSFANANNVNFFQFGRYTIAFNAVIENAIGSDGDDYIIGNNFDNDLQGGLGNDVLIGGAGDDMLNGGLGDDRYVLTFGHQAAVAFGHDSATIFEDGEGGQDRLEVYDYDEFLAIMDRDVVFERDFAFHRNDEDLFIELTLDNNAAEASIAIQRMDLAASQVETMRFFNGIDVDLVSLFNQMTNETRWTRFELLADSTANGFLVSAV